MIRRFSACRITVVARCTGARDDTRVVEHRRVPRISLVAGVARLCGGHVRRRHHRRRDARACAVTAFAIAWCALENALYVTGFAIRL